MSGGSKAREALLTQLRSATINGEIGTLLDALDRNPDFDIDSEVDTGRSYNLLMLACENSDAPEVVRFLVEECGANVNVQRVRIGVLWCDPSIDVIFLLTARSEQAYCESE